MCASIDGPDIVELGMDTFTIDGQYPAQLMGGIEIKSQCYVGVFQKYSLFPEPLRKVDAAFAPYLRDCQYRNCYSAECRFGRPGVGPWMIDYCSRFASPPSEAMIEMYTNFPEIVWHGAHGEMVNPKPLKKFAAECKLNASWAETHPMPIRIPKEIEQWIKLRNAVRINKYFEIVPQQNGSTEVGSAIGFGDTIKEAIDQCKAVCAELDKMKNYTLEAAVESFDDAQTEMDKLKRIGYDIFGNQQKAA
jgi:hypothetical protein